MAVSSCIPAAVQKGNAQVKSIPNYIICHFTLTYIYSSYYKLIENQALTVKLIKGTRWSVFFSPPTTAGSNMRPCGSFYVCSFVSMVSHHWTDQQETHLVRRGECKQKLHLQETPPVPLTHQLDIYLIIHKSFFRAETLHNQHYYPFTAFQLWRFDYKLITNWYFVKENHKAACYYAQFPKT